jgi:hypothetical protein
LNSTVGKGAVDTFRLRQIQGAPAQLTSASSLNQPEMVEGPVTNNGDWHLSLSGAC